MMGLDIAAAHAATEVGRGGPVILAHGIGGSIGHWDATTEALAERHRVVRFALAGSPEADRRLFSPSRHASILGFADDVIRLCEALGLRGALYVGHSMSAMAGLLAAVADPGLFRGIVALNGSPRYIDDARSGYIGGFTAQQVDALLESAAADYAAWAAGFAPLAMGNPDRPEFATEFARTLTALGPDVALTMFRAAFTGDFREAMPRVATPTLIVQSRDDPAVPLATAHWMSCAIPHADVAEIEATGHFPHLVDPDGVVEAVRAAAFA